MLIQKDGSVLLTAFIHRADDAAVRSQVFAHCSGSLGFGRTSTVPYQQQNAGKSVDHDRCTAFHESSEGWQCMLHCAGGIHNDYGIQGSLAHVSESNNFCCCAAKLTIVPKALSRGLASAGLHFGNAGTSEHDECFVVDNYRTDLLEAYWIYEARRRHVSCAIFTRILHGGAETHCTRSWH